MTQSPPLRLFDQAGLPFTLSKPPLAIGGEGAIHGVVGSPSSVVKVYNKPQSPERSSKLRAMARVATQDLLEVAAWPTSALYAVPGGPVAGILMPRVIGSNEVHHLYSVRQRKREFPNADWRLLVHAARNCAIAFDTIHRRGHVIGDVNQKNVLVSDQVIVRFVDCDSFQLRDVDGRVYRCAVGMPDYTPPELLGTSFQDVDRVPNHDLFGLAILLFQLLMMGRHPFAGRHRDGIELLPEKAIQGGHYAYARDSTMTRMERPPHSLNVGVLGDQVASMFERAFAPLRGAEPPPRPTALAWSEALGGLLAQCMTCSIDSRHAYPRSAGACPWCRFLNESGPEFFVPGGWPTDFGSALFDLAAVWGRIDRVARPNTTYIRPVPDRLHIAPRPIPPGLPPPTSRPVFEAVPAGSDAVDNFFEHLSAAGLFVCVLLTAVAPPVGLVGLAAFGAWFGYLYNTRGQRIAPQRATLEAQRREVEEINDELMREWEAENPDWVREYRRRTSRRDVLAAQLVRMESALSDASRAAERTLPNVYKELYSNKTSYDGLRDKHSADLKNAAARSAAIQLDHDLDSRLISRARLPNISAGRVASLSSFGIEIALDVKQLENPNVKIPGIGPKLTETLLLWRRSLIRSFKLAPGSAESMRAAIDREYLPRLRRLEAVLAAGPGRLQEVRNLYEARCAVLWNEIRAVVAQLAQAERDLEIMDRAVQRLD